MDTPKAQEIYRHFKGNLYKIVAIANHTESGEQLVIYQSVDDESKVYARPLEMFMSTVDYDKYPDATQSLRFERVEAAELPSGDAAFKLDPDLDAFLDADKCQKKLEILVGMKNKLTNDMLNTMAFSIGLKLNDGDIYTKYESLKNGLLILERYESDRRK